MIGITALYIVLQMVTQGILGIALANRLHAAGRRRRRLARRLGEVGAARWRGISMFGYLGGMTLSMPRVIYAFARDGFLPKALAAVDAVHHAPRAPSWCSR